MTEQPKPSIWELQERLRAWYEQEYKKAFPESDSEFATGRTMAAPGAWDELTPEQQEQRERTAYKLNRMVFALGTLQKQYLILSFNEAIAGGHDGDI